VAAGVFEAAILNTTSKNFFEDNIYYGLCVHTVNRGKDAKTIDVPALTNADKAMDNVIAAKPDYPEAYLYKARINSVMAKDDIMTESYQKYLDALTAKGPEEITKNKAKVTEAYNNMASFYANSDKAKAKELLNKTLALDPTNAYATESLKVLK
jgi:tetratricopeptide (TPR) repeat protein